MTDERLKNAPDYSQFEGEKFETYAYASVSDGSHVINGERVNPTGNDFRTEEYYRDYLNCGFEILMPQDFACIPDESDEAFAERVEAAKKLCRDAYAAGVKKVLIQDQRIQGLSATEGGLIGEGKAYASEKELDARVKEILSAYVDEPNFYGVLFKDEPKYTMAVSYGHLYKSIKRVSKTLGKDVYVQYNLFPMFKGCASTNVYAKFNPTMEEREIDPTALIINAVDIPDETLYGLYEKYLGAFADEMGIDYAQFDHYPIHSESISEFYIPALQIAAEFCRKRNIELRVVTYSASMLYRGKLMYRKMTEADERWLNNTLLSFGVKQISYFTYFTKFYNTSDNECFIDGASFVTWTGEKTDLYYYMQKILAENNKLAPVIKQFEYSASEAYVGAAGGDFNQVCKAFDRGDFKRLKAFSIDKECALVTELYDEKGDRYMYCYTNIANPESGREQTAQVAELRFSEGFAYALVFEKGEKRVEKLGKNGSLKLKASAGDGFYVIPF